MAEDLTPKQKEIKEKFTKARGYWSEEAWGQLLRLDPDFFDAYRAYSSKPWLQGVLPPKIKEFVYIAIDVACTHLNAPGTHVHIKNALGYGATKEEIMEVFELASVLGIHTLNMAVPILVEELKAAGKPALPEALTPKQKEIKEKFTKARGYWSEEAWGQLLRLAPDFFDAYRVYSSKPWLQGVLPPKIKEFVYIAIDVSCTHLHAVGTRQHIKNALGYGATAEEIMEVFELASVLGIHTLNMAVPILVEEFKAAGKPVL
ncbi:MAG: carboxymuconolactone decarboxylase family protein [Dehalococcoidales bacterium]|nr:carboxymuconolactone decarboxylase family protein [Dehalococcoidales bacterium]